MIKTIKNIFKQDNDGFKVPHNVQEAIPIDTIWKDGIFKVGKNKYSMTLIMLLLHEKIKNLCF